MRNLRADTVRLCGSPDEGSQEKTSAKECPNRKSAVNNQVNVSFFEWVTDFLNRNADCLRKRKDESKEENE